jgi:acetyl-CoA decarbonylase/synthase complex subunit gamma
MALSGIEIYKLLPQTNCKECGFPTCLAFSMKLAAKQVELDDCPYVTEESKAKLAESSAPPIRLIELKAAGGDAKAGNEVVLFRHEKTFYNRPGVFVRVSDTDEAAAIAEKAAAVNAFLVDYVGLELKLDGFAVQGSSPDAFAEAIKAVRGASGLPLVLVSDDPAVLEAGLGVLDGDEVPLLVGATADNWEAVAGLATGRGAPVAVSAPDLDTLADLAEKLGDAGVESLVLHPTSSGLGSRLAIQTQIRRLALKNFRPLGYPTIAFAGDAADGLEAAAAAQAIAKYAGFVVVDTFTPELAYALLVLRENIYTDPQKPIQVLPAVYEINDPKPSDPVLVTTNFSITYFSVANEVESSGLPAWLVVTDAEGMSVLTAWAAGKFDAERIAKSVKEYGVADKVDAKTIVLPGHVAVLSGELEEELPDWDVKVGPREAVDLPAFMKAVLA